MSQDLSRITCCFSGYRPEKMPFPSATDAAIPTTLYAPVHEAILSAYTAGYTRFITGMSRGFDLWAAQAVLMLCQEYPLSLHCAIPYAAQPNQWAAYWQEMYHAVRARAHSSVLLSPAYTNTCLLARNAYMVDASSRIICYYDGVSGGTKHTFTYAKKRGLTIDNLANPQLCLADI